MTEPIAEGVAVTSKAQMPQLPHSDYRLASLGSQWEEERITHMDGYTEEQMCDYARAYAEQETAALQQQLGECRGGYQTLEREVAALRAEVERLRQLARHLVG